MRQYNPLIRRRAKAFLRSRAWDEFKAALAGGVAFFEGLSLADCGDTDPAWRSFLRASASETILELDDCVDGIRQFLESWTPRYHEKAQWVRQRLAAFVVLMQDIEDGRVRPGTQQEHLLLFRATTLRHLEQLKGDTL
jgi:hypothetical protein